MILTAIPFLTQTDPHPVADSLIGRPSREKAGLKADAIVHEKRIGKFVKNNITIEITDVSKIDGGVQVYAKAWKNGTKIGFGADGTVETERFLIYNPPILVPDPNGDISIDYDNAITGEKITKTFREDPMEALRQSIAHTVQITQKNGSNVIPGKVGHTTSTFYPDAGSPGTNTMDASFLKSDASYATAHDAATADTLEGNTTSIYAQHTSAGGYDIRRLGITFDTSAIDDAATISSVVTSIWCIGTANGADADSVRLVSFAPTSNSAFATGDFDKTKWGTTAWATDITIASFSASAYKDFTENATGISNVSLTGISKRGFRLVKDVNNTAPSAQNYVQIASADTSGTTNDPTMTVTFTSASATPSNQTISIE